MNTWLQVPGGCRLHTPTAAVPRIPAKRRAHHPTAQVGVSVRFTMGGSEGHRLLVACMHRLDDMRMMAAVDHKGRLLYANSSLASLLGYKLNVLRAKELAALLPPPYNVLHSKWLKVCEGAQEQCARCLALRFPAISWLKLLRRTQLLPLHVPARMSVQLVSSNGTAVPVKASISHHPGSLSQGATWAVAFTRSSQAAADDERRLLLRIMLDGTIVAVSRGTPSALFGVEPSRVVGTKLEHLVDVCWEYSKGGEPRAGRGKWRQAFVVSCNTGGMEFVLAASSTTCTWLTGATH